MTPPDPTPEHLMIARQLRAKARTGWYLGDMPTLQAYGAKFDVVAATTPELMVRLLLSRDKMHHSVGWWRNVGYEYCWHLSISAADRLAVAAGHVAHYEELPRDELRYWSRLIFGEHVNKLWNEPGGTDPRQTRAEQRRNALIWHLRMFLDPDSIDERRLPWTGEPFIPPGEVYDLVRWVDGLTPPKVDR
jgi:hypothetical protein